LGAEQLSTFPEALFARSLRSSRSVRGAPRARRGEEDGWSWVGGLLRLVATSRRRRLVAGAAFALLAAAAALAYFASFLFRARGWHRLFPREQCPDQARCLASVGAAAASGAVLPFRLDYLIKVGMLRKLGGYLHRAGGDRPVDHLARDDRRDRDAAALDLGDDDERVRP
jgi:hypothetical protein